MKPKTELSQHKNNHSSSSSTSSSSRLLEIALEKSESAVNLDSGGDNDGDYTKALDMYKEAIEALQKVLDNDSDHINNKSRLKSIVCV